MKYLLFLFALGPNGTPVGGSQFVVPYVMTADQCEERRQLSHPLMRQLQAMRDQEKGAGSLLVGLCTPMTPKMQQSLKASFNAEVQ